MSFPLVFRGRARYQSPLVQGSHELVMAVDCRFGSLPPTQALFDTAAQWCVLPSGIAILLGHDPDDSMSTVRYSTRFGMIEGILVRESLTFIAQEGESAEIDATWFLSNDWPGPPVLGWTGGLERISFAFDTSEGWFYFGKKDEN